MKFVRWILGKLILGYEKVASPKPVVRDAQIQALLDEKAKRLSLYQFKACPFCVKVRFALKKQNLNVEICDAKNDEAHRQTLLNHGGCIKVPCLRVKSECGTRDEWLYESDAIIHYLEQQVVKI